eukprot:gene7422-10115_t
MLFVVVIFVIVQVSFALLPSKVTHGISSYSIKRVPSTPLVRFRNEIQTSNRKRVQPLRDLLGLGPAEIAVTLVVALVLFGPETLKSLSKDVGRAAAELKEIPKTFKEGMDEGAESAQVQKMKAIAAEKRKLRDEKLKAEEEENATVDSE